MRSKAAKVALCGVVSALSVVLMLMTGIVPIATIALPALAGCLTIAIVAETNVRYGFAVYCVVSVLAILETTMAVWVLQIPLSEMEVFGKWSIPILAVMLNVVFVLYDYSMNGLIVLYIRRLHPLVQKYIK